MKIKIITLFNKIANNEILPVLIKYDGRLWKLCENEREYYREIFPESVYFFEDYIPNNFDLLCILNDEIEIIEEEKEIEKLGKNFTFEDSTNELTKGDWQVSVISQKINELVDEINKLKKEKK